MFNSLKLRIVISVAGIVAVSLAMIIFFFGQNAKNELSCALESNALNLLEATKNHVESQYNSIVYHQSAMQSRRKRELKNHTTIALAIVKGAFRQYKKGLISEREAKTNAISALDQLRYDDGTGYFWINDTTRPYPKMVMHPTISELNGSILDLPEFNCALGRKENLFKASVDVCLEKGEGYIDYLWPKPTLEGLTKQQPKISYVRIFKPWNWVVGTGVYVDDIEKDVEDRINAVIEDLNKTILKQKIGENGYFFIFSDTNSILVHPRLAGENGNSLVNPVTGNLLFEEMKQAALSFDNSIEYLWDKSGFEGDYRFPKKAYISYFKPLGWYIGSSVYKEDFESKISDLTNRMVVLAAVFLVIAIVVSLLVAGSIITPLNKFIASIKKTDRYGIPIDTIAISGTNEIKLLSTTMNTMIETISRSGDSLILSQERYHSLFNDSPVPLWEGDFSGVYDFLERVRELGVNDFRAFFDEDPTHIKECVRNVTILDVNLETLKLFHAEDKEKLLENLEKIFTERTFDVFKEQFISVAEGASEFESEAQVQTLTGEFRYIYLRLKIDKNGSRSVRAVLAMMDITKRKHAEENLHKAQNYIYSIINSMPSVLVGVDSDGNITQWNKVAVKTTGITADVAKGKKISDVYPQLKLKMKKITESIHSSKIIQLRKQARQTEHGTCFEDVTIYPLITDGIEGAVIRVDDVTEKIRLEEMMIQSEKMLSVGGLASGMAHEINNPLSGMLQTANVMANRLGRELDRPANRKAAEDAGTSVDAVAKFMEARGIHRMIDTITESGSRIAEIVANMLSFARKSEAIVSTHDMSELLDKTLELAATDYDLKKQYDFKTIEIIKEYDEDLPMVLCEGSKIQQVFLNIFKNGAQAMQELEMGKSKFIVRTGYDEKRKFAVVEIEDNGPGMDEKTRKKIFEPFFTTKPEGVGTGLGLSVSYFIVTENHGGEMIVESEPGVMTKFTIKLPVENI